MAETRILVVGAGGFLGNHICNHFSKRNYDIAVVGRNLTIENLSQIKPRFSKCITLPDESFHSIVIDFQPNVIIYCAGSSPVQESFKFPYEDFQKSVLPCIFVLETIRKYAMDCSFIFLSSAAVYGNPTSVPIQEELPCLPISPYGYHKKASELIVDEYSSLYGVRACVLRIFSAYGEGLSRQVVHDLCKKALDPSSSYLEVYGTGKESRDFIHASDVAQAIEFIILSKLPGTYNIGTGKQTLVSDLANLVIRLTDSKKAVRFTKIARVGDPINWEADISRIKRLGFHPTISLESGITKYVSWLSSTQPSTYNNG